MKIFHSVISPTDEQDNQSNNINYAEASDAFLRRMK
jgi:hypothetical protein